MSVIKEQTANHKMRVKPMGLAKDRAYRHAGDWGDILYFLPIMKDKPGSLYIEATGFTRQRLTPDKWAALSPLLEAQKYVLKVAEFKGENTIDANKWRSHYNGYSNLAVVQAEELGCPLESLDKQWLFVEQRKVAPVVVNRTMRYHGHFPIDYVGKEAIFIGNKDEHEFFEEEFGKIAYYETPTMLDAAQVIAGSDLFVGNQSSCYAVCEGMKHNSILEVYLPSANCCRKRANARYCCSWRQQKETIFTEI